MHDVLDKLGSVTVFSGFSESQLLQICEKCALYEAGIGEIIIEEGTPATEILIIIKGRVAIVLDLEDEPLEIFEFGQGHCIGEASVIGIQNHSASAVVTEEATLMVLPRQVLMELYDQDKTLFSLLILNFARELARRLHHSDKILLQYGQRGHNSR